MTEQEQAKICTSCTLDLCDESSPQCGLRQVAPVTLMTWTERKAHFNRESVKRRRERCAKWRDEFWRVLDQLEGK